MTVFDPNALSEVPQAVVQTFADNNKAPAVLVEIWRDGLSLTQSSGVVDIESGTAASTDNLVEVGSQTKMMTATVVMQLAAEGAIDLDAPLSTYVDAAVIGGIANADTATVRELLSHRSGIVDFDDVTGPSGRATYIEALLTDPTTPITKEVFLGIVQDQPAHFEPGEGFSYSNTNYLLLEKLIEGVTGQTLADEFQTRIFDAVGMDSAVMDGLTSVDGQLSGYIDLGDGVATEVTDIPIELSGAGGVVATIGDMIQFMDALLVSQTLLPPEMLEEMTGFLAPDGTPDPNGVGLGLFSLSVQGQNFVGHAGSTLGHATVTLVHVESGTIVSVAGSHFEANPEDVVLEIFEAVLTDAGWMSFDITADEIEVMGTAADLDVTEIETPDGPTTEISVGSVSISLDQPMSEIDTGQFTFSDGSTLFIADDAGDSFNVLQDAWAARTSDNHLIGQDGNDVLRGGHGGDRIDGGDGNDVLIGRRGDDQIDGGAGNDVLRGGRGDDQLSGGDGNDVIRGGRGDDDLKGGAGNDILNGGRGDDMIAGDGGMDLLFGGRGADVLEGGAGDDVLTGGRGADQFVFQSGDGADVVTDFSAIDSLVFTSVNPDDLHLTQVGSDVELSYGHGDVITLENIDMCQIDTNDFIFA
ncbi:serine hydrolase [Thalassobius sp. I31.1]|uniref:serine hydrolase n=1 Tax=Thalassobius sp. I31.1 TaxID=2109912 RepID=UPI000D1A9EBA|nr:serine hydrolase [Thalassobius sp. I31.1]